MTPLGVLLFVAVMLTLTMFLSRQMMLGFPCAMFWAIAGGQAYTLSTTPWGDIYFYLFFACTFGMTIFTIFGAFALRKEDLSEPDSDEEKLFDEEKEPDVSGAMEEDTSSRSQKVRDRADQRRDHRRGGTG